LIVDVLDSFLNWDSKFFATIGLLIAKPWRLTNEFLAGNRVRYVHPLRLYLLASILFFFAVNYWEGSIHLQPTNLSPEARAEIGRELNKQDLPADVRAKIEQALNLNNPAPAPTARAGKEASSQWEKRETSDHSQRPLVESRPDNTSFEKWLEKHAKEKLGNGANGRAFLITLTNHLPAMMLICIPLFALLLKILYVRRKVFYIDHLIYALHIHSFVYLATILITLATIGLNRVAVGAFTGWLIAPLWIGFAAQIFLSIRRVYQQSWLISILKFLFGGLAYLLVLSNAIVTPMCLLETWAALSARSSFSRRELMLLFTFKRTKRARRIVPRAQRNALRRRVYDAAGNVIETHDHKAISKSGSAIKCLRLHRQAAIFKRTLLRGGGDGATIQKHPCSPVGLAPTEEGTHHQSSP
jgi:hypothetical protein